MIKIQMSEQKNCYLVHVPYDAGSGFVDEKIIEKFIQVEVLKEIKFGYQVNGICLYERY